MKKCIPLILLIYSLLTIGIDISAAHTVISGSVQFPSSIPKIPAIRMYHLGHIIQNDINNDMKKIIFELPKRKEQKLFFVLITKEIFFKSKTTSSLEKNNNTIEYWYVPQSQQYKLFQLELLEKTALEDGKEKNDYQWSVSEKRLPLETGRIPDEALVLYYHPHWIKKLEGGTQFSLPTINIHENIIELAFSEKNFYDSSNELLIAAIESDTLHDIIRHHTKYENNRVTVAAPVV